MLIKAVCVVAVFAAGTGAAAAQCAANFRQEGVPLVTGITYRTTTTLPMPPAAALKGLASAVAAEGFNGIRDDKALGAISAFQETSGSGRPQTLRVVARKSGKGTRVDASFFIQPGQVASADMVRDSLCRMIESVE